MWVCAATTSLSKNRITELNEWSKVEEAIRFLDTTPIEQKKKVIKEQLDVMGPSKVGTKVYNEDTIIRAFEYFSISRSCYERFQTDYKLPSVKTLTKRFSFLIDRSSCVPKTYRETESLYLSKGFL